MQNNDYCRTSNLILRGQTARPMKYPQTPIRITLHLDGGFDVMHPVLILGNP